MEKFFMMMSGKNDFGGLATKLLNQLADEISSRILIELENTRSQSANTSPTNQKLLITTEELCHSLSVSKSTLINLRKQGLPIIKIGDSVRFDLEEVKKYINNLKISNHEKR